MKYTNYLLFALLLVATSTFAGSYVSSDQGDLLEGWQAKATLVRAEEPAPLDKSQPNRAVKLVRSAAVCLKAGEAGAPAADPEIVPVGLYRDVRASRGIAVKTVGAYLAKSPGRQTLCQR